MNTTPSTTSTYPSSLRHPEWCDRQDCATRGEAGHTEHVSSYWEVTQGKYGIKLAVQRYEGEGLSPLIRIRGRGISGALQVRQVQPLIEYLQRAVTLLNRPAVPAPVVETTTAPDGSRTVTVSTSVTHPAWCDPAECFHEDPDTHPIHRSADVLIPDAGEGFSAGIQQDGPDPATIWSVGPGQFTDMTPKQVRAYAAELLSLADRIDPPVAA